MLEIKKYLRKGDLKSISEELSVSYALVIAVASGRRKNSRVLEAIITKAEQNRLHDEELTNRIKSLP